MSRLRKTLEGVALGFVAGIRLLPGLAAIGCAVAGTWLLFGVGYALLVAAALLLVIDGRT